MGEGKKKTKKENISKHITYLFLMFFIEIELYQFSPSFSSLQPLFGTFLSSPPMPPHSSDVCVHACMYS